MSDTFIRWLAGQEKRDDPVGDLARDMRDDRRSGCLRGRTPQRLRRHLLDHHDPCEGALRALDRAAAEYAMAAVPSPHLEGDGT